MSTSTFTFRLRVLITLFCYGIGLVLLFHDETKGFAQHINIMPLKLWGLFYLVLAILRTVMLKARSKHYNFIGSLTSGYVFLWVIPFVLAALNGQQVSTAVPAYIFIATTTLLVSLIPLRKEDGLR